MLALAPVQSKENSELGVVGLAICSARMLEFIVPTNRLITWGIVAVGLGLITANLLFDYRRVEKLWPVAVDYLASEQVRPVSGRSRAVR